MLAQIEECRIQGWNNCEELPESFRSAWSERIARSPHAHFGLDLEQLETEASQGHRGGAFLLDEPGLRGAIVARQVGNDAVSGWPWRWQAVVEAGADRGAVGLTAEESFRIYRRVASVLNTGRFLYYAPHPAPPPVPSFLAGKTLIVSLANDDDTLFASLERTRRQAIRRARSNGFEVIEPSRPEHLARWAELLTETKRRHGLPVPEALPAPPPEVSGPRLLEAGRWLLLGARDGQIESGILLGISSGRMIEARTSATSEVGRRLGVFPLVMFEAERRARDRGYLWCNVGGDTLFKRDMVGKLATPVQIHCWLGGNRRWMLLNHGEAWMKRARITAGRVARSWCRHGCFRV